MNTLESQVTDSLALERLIEALADAKRMTAEGNPTTALHIAVYQGRATSVHLLLLVGFDPNEQDFNGQSPLHIAVIQNRLDLIWPLMVNGADMGVTDCEGLTPGDHAEKDVFRMMCALSSQEIAD